MKKLFFLIFLPFLIFPVYSQDKDAQSSQPDILLIPILETVFFDNVMWNPYWPFDIPPDGFFINITEKQPDVIELYNDTDKYVVRRDGQGRLAEFPFFLSDGYADVQAEYSLTGALKNLGITKYSYSQDDDSSDKDSSDKDTSNKDAQATGTKISVVFPDDFLPFSEFSPGGIFPALTATSDDASFSVFIFESPLFLTETWYDEEGNLSVISKASVFIDKGFWRIRSIQVNNDAGVSSLDYFHDSYGNITEIRGEDSVVSALYIGNRPSYQKDSKFQYELQWDTQGILTTVKATGEDNALYAEYRYGYEKDDFGNWISRQETAFTIQFGLLAPNPSYSRGIWNRRIEY